MRKQAHPQTTNRQKLAALDYITKLRAPRLSIKKDDLLALFDHKYCFRSIDAWRRGRYRIPPAAFAILESHVEAMIQALRKALDELRPPEHHSGLEKAKATVRAREARIARDLDAAADQAYWAQLLHPEKQEGEP